MTRLRPILAFFARAVIIAIAIISIPWRAGAALVASGEAPIVSPPTADALMSYVETYGWIVGSLTVAYLAAKWLLKKNDSTHWIAQGRALAVVTTIIGVAGAALQAYTSGTPWSGVLATAVLGLLHLADAQVTPAPVKAQAGFTRLSVMLMIAAAGVALCAAAGCTKAQARQTASAGAVAALDCESVHLDAKLEADLRALADAEVQHWIAGGASASTDAIEADLAPIRSDLGRCAIAAALAAATTLIAPPAPVAGTAVSALSAAGPDPAVVRDRFRIAARALGWAPVRIVGGDVL